MFFWEQADPGTGIVRDRSGRDGGPSANTASRDIGSIASVGFGLAGMCVAAERGWRPRNRSFSACERRWEFFAQEESAHERGWFYHFVNLHTGAREWQSELSSIDTALLLGGVLTVRRCFDADPDIVRLSQAIYRRVDFTVDAQWQLRRSVARLEAGVGLSPGAMGSLLRADDPLPAGHRFTRAPNPCDSVARVVAPDHAVRGLLVCQRRGSAVRPSVLARVDRLPRANGHRGAARRLVSELGHGNARAQGILSRPLTRVPRLTENVWGITSSDSRKGYVAWGGPPRHADIDGSVVPAAAAGSLMFDPASTVPALREMHRRFGDRIYGRYGFTDAFHPTDGWVNPDVIGIDLGITLLSAENLRTGHVWSWFMKNPEITTALDKAGVK